MQLIEHPAIKTATEAGIDEVMERLAAPFELTEVRFKPAVVSGNRALALAYVDARVIQDRLDDVLGVTGWQDEYECLPDGSVVCKLRLKINDEWITKMDVGGQSEQPDEGDRRKAAFSDSLKRAAVKFGIGRYLYRLPQQWVDYDAQRRQFVRTPSLPPSALPRPTQTATPVKVKAEVPLLPAPAAVPVEEKNSKAAKPKKEAAAAALPANGEELQKRLYAYDARLAGQKLCKQGELVKFIVESGVKEGYDRDLSTWAGPAIVLAAEQTKLFEAQRRQKSQPHKEVA